MSYLAPIIGLLVPGIAGWLLLAVLEGKTPVLLKGERIALGLLLGLTGCMFLTFLLHVTTGMTLTLLAYALAPIIVSLLCGGLYYWRKPSTSPATPHSPALTKWQLWILGPLLLLCSIKIAATAITFLFVTPVFLDDTIDNWHLRGKVFYEDRALTLVLPKEDPRTSPLGVSSYPPTVPLSKAWMATLAGGWSEPVVSSVQAAWYVLALSLLYFSLRRITSLFWALLGVYVLASLPLYLLHGTNPYADVFLSAHVFAAVSLLFHTWREPDAAKARTFLKLAGLAIAFLPFTKNEGLLVYLPPLLVLCAVLLWKGRSQGKTMMQNALLLLGPLVLIALPWLLYKWTHGLTFGNAKPFTTLSLGWQPGVITAVFINTFLEGNWLLLFPLLFALLLLRWRTAFGWLIVPTAFFLMIYVGQMLLYLFTALSTEAVLQTGYARGLIHLSPTIALLVTLLLWDARDTLHAIMLSLRHPRSHS